MKRRQIEVHERKCRCYTLRSVSCVAFLSLVLLFCTFLCTVHVSSFFVCLSFDMKPPFFFKKKKKRRWQFYFLSLPFSPLPPPPFPSLPFPFLLLSPHLRIVRFHVGAFLLISIWLIIFKTTSPTFEQHCCLQCTGASAGHRACAATHAPQKRRV